MTKPHRGFTAVHHARLPLARFGGWVAISLGVIPRFAPRRYQRRTSGLGTGVDTRLMAAFLPPHSYSATSCRTVVAPHVHAVGRNQSAGWVAVVIDRPISRCILAKVEEAIAARRSQEPRRVVVRNSGVGADAFRLKPQGELQVVSVQLIGQVLDPPTRRGAIRDAIHGLVARRARLPTADVAPVVGRIGAGVPTRVVGSNGRACHR